MVKRVYVEKKEGFDIEAQRLLTELCDFFGDRFPELGNIRRLRILRRYDTAVSEQGSSGQLDNIQFEQAAALVFSEPQCDRVFFQADVPAGENSQYFAIEYLPGQYDQRADSAEQCTELVTGIKPHIKTASVYIFESPDKALSNEALDEIKKYLINPVDSREASLELPGSLEAEQTLPADVPVLTGFIGSGSAPERAESLEQWLETYNLAMSALDLDFCRSYFIKEGRDPTLAELRLLDTYWSDHCRHTTFLTILENIDTQDLANYRSVYKADSPENALKLYRELRKEVYAASTVILTSPSGVQVSGGISGNNTNISGEKVISPPETLMDMATLGAKVLKKRGMASDVDQSAEINACTIKVEAEFAPADGKGETIKEPWLLLFKNETHNHPTEIEPFGGAATCLGGAIRDPLSGRAYVHQAMRITGGGDPRATLAETIAGKLPQIKIVRDAAHGYSSYGNQIGIATGQVTEFYHPGFLAKRLELGAVIGAVPQEWVRREEPLPGDVVILVGGKTGRDGIGGATGSSKGHSGKSVQVSGAEVQKGNAVEERKLQRLFRKPEVCGLIKRCNDFGAGGVSVAVGELAAGLDIELDAVPKKYLGLDGTELAISESQERMAVVVAKQDAHAFIALAAAENLQATVIAKVTAGNQITPGVNNPDARLRMFWQGKTIINISREFLDSNGAPRRADVLLPAQVQLSDDDKTSFQKNESFPAMVILDNLERELTSLRTGSRRGLVELFDGSIGAGSVLFPWGGQEQGTPECGMAALLPSLDKKSLTSSLMTFGYDPAVMSKNPFQGAKGSILEALAKFACLGGDYTKARLSFQEYFERPKTETAWGKPAAALLAALEAQINLGIPAIGGKDSMSGNYTNGDLEISVPPTFVAFAAGTAPVSKIRSGALSGKSGNIVVLLSQALGSKKNPAGQSDNDYERFKANMKILKDLDANNLVCSAWPVGSGGIAAALAVMAFGNMCGVEAYASALSLTDEFNYQGSILVEIDGGLVNQNSLFDHLTIVARTLGAGEPVFRIVRESSSSDENSSENVPDDSLVAEVPLVVLRRAYEYPLSQVYPQTSSGATAAEPTPAIPLPAFIQPFAFGGSISGDTSSLKKRTQRKVSGAVPLVVLPVFPGTNCEWDMERAFVAAGAKTRQVIFRNQNQDDIKQSLKELEAAINTAQIIALSGGFSAGDEPDGSGKFIANVLRSPLISEALMKFLDERDGLVLGICNGFQALIKTGLLPHGSFQTGKPTLTYNTLGRHVSRMVRTKVMSNLSPWLGLDEPGAIHTIPISHGEGRIVIDNDEAQALFKAGQVGFCYVDAEGNPALAEPDNPNGSDFAIEGLCSPDGRIMGKMGHSERAGDFVHINIPGNKKQRIFEAGVRYFT